jgi:hypothetical protein
MTTEDIIRMAQEAGMIKMTTPSGADLGDWWGVDMPDIERFANLVATAEREECAQVVEQAGIDGYGTLAAALLIRERGAP